MRFKWFLELGKINILFRVTNIELVFHIPRYSFGCYLTFFDTFAAFRNLKSLLYLCRE